MQNKTSAESGFFRRRVLVALSFSLLGLGLAIFSFATPSPPSGILSTSNRSITYMESDGGVVPNPSEVALSMPNCTAPNSCSTFNLTIDASVGTPAAGYDPAQYEIFLQWQWALPSTDYDIFIENAAGTAVIASNRSTADPSSITLPSTTAAGVYKIVIALATGAPIAYAGTIDLQLKPAVSGICNPNMADCTPPRYQNYSAGPGQADNAGEPSLGVDWNPNVATLKHDKVNTGGVAFFTSGPNEWRVNFDDCSSPAVNLWEDVSAPFDQQFVLSDPIGFVDHYTSVPLGIAYPPPHTSGRIFAIDLVGGQGDSAGAYSDVDGNSYVPPDGGPGGTGGPGAGPDHETLGGGPYAGTPPAAASYPGTGPKNAIYYCSQNIAAEAQCSRSDDGGKTFGASIPIFTPSQCTGGIHGHVKVAPDGTVYVPNSSCGTTGNDGVAVSIDNGLTWAENNVPGSTGSQDPSVGVGQNNVGKPGTNLAGTNTMYLGWVSGDGHAHVAHSGDRGATYTGDTDVGAPFGIEHAVFPVVVAGDDNRAAFAFLGTGPGIATSGTCDPYGATLNCKNIWHLYIATTYDGGANWITIDSTPDDPVQKGTVCLQGTTCAGGRNLLDFNDFAIDSQGRGLVGYADGCVNCNNTFTSQSSSDHGTVTRQSGGRRLFAFFDPPEPSVPAAPQLVSATLQPPPTGGALVTWLEPDNGGTQITGYKVYRGTTSGGETFLADVSGATNTKYLDLTPPNAPNVFYYVTAVNRVPGESAHCREVSLVPVTACTVNCGDKCTYPYLNVAPAGSAGTVPSDPTQGELTIQYVNIGEPFTSCLDNSITFLMKVATLDPGNTGSAVLPPNSEWQIVFDVKGTDNANHTIFVDLNTFSPNTPASPAVVLGRKDPCSTGCSTLDTGTCTASAASTCANISATYAADGTIQIKLKTSAPLVFPAPGTPGVGTAFTWDPSAPGTTLTNIAGNTLAFLGAGAGFLETVQTTSAPDPYVRSGNVSCQSTPPIPVLSATPMTGPAPLNVDFDGTGSHEPPGACGTINSYTINFGDGSAPETNGTGLFSHPYTADGDYPARLTVSDTFGQVSSNFAQVIITVGGGGPTPTPTATPNGTATPTPTATATATPAATPTATPTGTPRACGTPVKYTNTGTITIDDNSPASPYPSTIDVSVQPGTVSKVTVDLTGLTHNFPDDVGVLLVGPTGVKVRLMTDVGGGGTGFSLTNANITFDDAASIPVPDEGPMVSGTSYKPTEGAVSTLSSAHPPDFAGPAPSSPYSNVLSSFNGTDPNGTWRLFVDDDTAIDGGAIQGGWSVTITTVCSGATPTPTATATATATPVSSATPTATATATASPTATATSTPTVTPVSSATPTATATATASPTATATSTPTATPGSTATPTSTPTATATATATATPTTTATSTPTATPTATPAQLLNISTRARVLTGDNILIGGFIITGNDPKKVLLLAKGPSINSSGNPVPGRMADPTLELHSGNGALMTSNDDWKDSPERTQIESSGLAPTDDHESAIIRTLVPGVYTGILAGKNNTTGIALIEIYDLDANSSLLANISSRGLVDTGDNVMIGGFIAGNHTGNTKVLVRGIGPSLQGSVPNPLADPILELHDSNGNTLETNDNWKDSPERSEIEATGIPPSNDLESAILKPVSPAGYTAILRGKTGTGIAVVEIYNLR